MAVYKELANQKPLKVIYSANLVVALTQKTALYIIWKMTEFLLSIVEDITGINKIITSDFTSAATVRNLELPYIIFVVSEQVLDTKR